MGYSNQQDRSYAATTLLDGLTPTKGLTVLRQDVNLHSQTTPYPGFVGLTLLTPDHRWSDLIHEQTYPATRA